MMAWTASSPTIRVRHDSRSPMPLRNRRKAPLTALRLVTRPRPAGVAAHPLAQGERDTDLSKLGVHLTRSAQKTTAAMTPTMSDPHRLVSPQTGPAGHLTFKSSNWYG